MYRLGTVFAAVMASGAAWGSAGADYLASRVNTDGSYAQAGDIATAFQSTAETLNTFAALGDTTQPGLASALQYLNAEPYAGTEYLTRRILAGIQAGQPVSTLLADLKTRQNIDGGFGEQVGYSSAVLDTAFALEAFAIAGQSQTPAVSNGLLYLTGQQQSDGSWKDSSSEPSVYIAALAMRAVWLHRSAYPVSGAVSKAQSYLLSQRSAGGLWAESYQTALSLLAILPNLVDRSPVQASVDALRAQQLANGSFDNDTYVTALALRALSDSTQPAVEEIILSGRTIDGDTGLALSGATVSLSGPTSESLITGNDGMFSFRALSAGRYSVALSKSGYAGFATSTSLAAGDRVDLGTLALLKSATNPTTGTIRGIVTDASFGEPISGARVTTSAGQGTSTGGDGSYQLSDVQPGSLSVAVSADGFGTATVHAEIVAGGTVLFSPALVRGIPPGDSNVVGIVRDGATQAPLANALVSVAGTSYHSILTGSDGRFELRNLKSGPVVIEAALDGYDSVSASTSLVEGATIRFSPDLFPMGTTPEGSNTSTLRGTVVDSGTLAPIAGTAITVYGESGTRTFLTGPDGRFEITGVAEAEIAATFAKTSYLTTYLSIPLEFFSDTDLGEVRLRMADATQLLPDIAVKGVDVSGAVTDAQTLAVSGVLTAAVANEGTAIASSGWVARVFADYNRDGLLQEGTDAVLGAASFDDVIVAGEQRSVSISLQGLLMFRGAPIAVQIDAEESLAELDEGNNVFKLSDGCEAISGDVIVWAGDTEGGSTVPDMGDDITLNRGTNGRRFYLDTQTESAHVFAGNDDTRVRINSGSEVVLNKDQFLSLPARTRVRIDATKPVVVGTVGGTCCYPFNDWGKALIEADIEGGSIVRKHYGYNPRNNGFLTLIGYVNGTSYTIRPLPTGTPISGTVGKYGELRIGLGSIRHFVLETSQPLLALLTHDYHSGVYPVVGTLFYPTVDGRSFYGREHVVYPILFGQYAHIVIFASEDAQVQFYNTAGQLVLTTPVIPAGTSFKPTGLANRAIYSVVSTGKVAIELNSANGNTTVPPVPAGPDNSHGSDAGEKYLFATFHWWQGAMSVGNIGDSPAALKLTDLSTGSVVLDTTVEPSSFIFKGALGTAYFRLDVGDAASADLTAAYLRILDNGNAQPATVRARIGNGGATSSPDGTAVSFYDGNLTTGGRLLGTVSMVSLGAGQYQDVDLTGVSGLTGQDVHVVVDSLNQVPECDEANNSHSIPFRTEAALGDIEVSTDAPAYGPRTDAVLGSVSLNTGSFPDTYTAELQVLDAGGNVVVAFGPQALGSIPSTGAVELTRIWGTGNTLSGNYFLKGILRRDDGTLVDEDTVTFAIGSGAGAQASLRTTTDRPIYHTTDRVQIGNLAKNLTANVIIPNALLRLSVANPAGQIVLAQDIPLGELPPNALRERDLAQVLSAAPQGIYQIAGTLLDGSGALLASASASYEVRENAALSIIGGVTVQFAQVQQGEPQTCTDTVSNRGTVDVTDLALRQTLARLDQDQTIGQTETAVDVAAGASETLTRSFGTAALEPGDYACALEAYVNNAWTGLGYATFAITPEPTNLSTTVATDRPVYEITGEALLTAPVQSLMQFRTVKGAIQHLDIAAQNGSVVFTQEVPLADLAPGAVLTTQLSYAFSDAAEGIYSVRDKVLDGGAIVASNDTTYQVKKNLAQALSGSVTAEKAEVQQGDTQTCTDLVESSSIYPFTNVPVRQRLLYTGQAEPIASTEHTLSPAAQGSETMIRAFGTETLAQGDYVCALDALIDGAWTGLGTAGFKVTPPPIRVDASLGLGGKGRVLILLDANPPPAAIGQTEPAASTQRGFIETLLTNAGWSYTIVTDKDAFAWEMRSGDYSLYALFAESVKLDQPVQKELREAVYRGEGLLDAGSHDQRHQNFDDALGIKYIGKHSSVQGVDVFTTTPSILSTGSAGLTLKDKTLRAQFLNAVKLGRYIGVSSDDLAIATRDYGQGKSVYMGFDLLAEATLAGDTSFHASLILQSLTHVQPSYAELASGQVGPLQLTLTNRGIAVTGRAQLPLPAGSVVVDRNDATVQNNTLTWTYSLNEGEEKTLTAWVRLPTQAGTLDLTANVQIGTAPSYTDHATASLTVNTVQQPGLTEARALAASDIAFKKVQLWLDKADAALTANKPDFALGDLVQAADEAMKIAHPQATELRLMIDQALLDIGRLQ